VVIDDNYEDVSNIIMSDDGTGTGIRIPSMLIGRSDGEILKNFLKNASPEDASMASLIAEFIMEKPDNRVEYDIWFSSSDDRALDFIRDFEEYN